MLAKLYESPVHVPPVGLSRPYAYIWYVPTAEGAVTVTVNVAVRRSAESVGRPYTPFIHGTLLTMKYMLGKYGGAMVLICRPHEMVVVSTMRDPGVAGFADDEIVHELIPTLPSGTVVDVVLDEVVLDDVVVDDVVVAATGATVVVVEEVVVVEVVVEVEVVVVVVEAGTVVVVVVVEVVVVGAVVSIVTVLASALEAGPAFDAASLAPLAAKRAITVPSDEQVTETVIEVPLEELGENEQLDAVPPALLKSPEATPETVSLKASV